jgi:hypothetical protein
MESDEVTHLHVTHYPLSRVIPPGVQGRAINGWKIMHLRKTPEGQELHWMKSGVSPATTGQTS